MKKLIPLLIIPAAFTLTLTACSWNPFAPSSNVTPQPKVVRTVTQTDGMPQEIPPTTGTGEPLGGNVAKAMDETDRNKLFHALDNPLGKSTHWTNAATDVSYTATPIEKTTINGNQFCRRYTILASRNGNERKINGTACVGDDGSWKAMD